MPPTFKRLAGQFMRLLLKLCSHVNISANYIYRARTIKPVGLTSAFAPHCATPINEMDELWDTVCMESSAGVASASPRTSSDDANSQEESSPMPVANYLIQRKRKAQSTYYARKDELKELRDESDELMRRLAELQEKQRLRELPLKSTLGLNASLLSQLENTRRTIAGSQLLMGSTGAECAKQVLGGYIHLPADPIDRKRILVDMKPKRIQDALEYLLQRSEFLDLRLPTRQIENCVTAEGNHITYHFEVATFKGNSLSVEDIFHDILYFVRNQEMEMAEKLGTLNIRESDAADDVIDATQVRIVSANTNSFVDEKNIVLHSQFFPHSPRLGQPHGVFAVDSVDKDDAFPYQPGTRVRKDITVASLTLECPQTDPDEPRTVAIVRWAQEMIHNSPLATYEELERLSRYNVSWYFDSMSRVIRERIAWRRNNIVDATAE